MRSAHDPQRTPLDEAAIAEWTEANRRAKAAYYGTPQHRHTCACGTRTRLPVCDRCRQRKARAEKESK